MEMVNDKNGGFNPDVPSDNRDKATRRGTNDGGNKRTGKSSKDLGNNSNSSLQKAISSKLTGGARNTTETTHTVGMEEFINSMKKTFNIGAGGKVGGIDGKEGNNTPSKVWRSPEYQAQKKQKLEEKQKERKER